MEATQRVSKLLLGSLSYAVAVDLTSVCSLTGEPPSAHSILIALGSVRSVAGAAALKKGLKVASVTSSVLSAADTLLLPTLTTT